MSRWPRSPTLSPTLMLALFWLVALSQPSAARQAVEIESPAGIKAWLVADPGVPIVAVGFAFLGGSAQDPPGRSGLASVLAAMLDQGTAALDAGAFKAQLGALGSRLSASASQRAINGGLVTLKRHLAASANLLRDALLSPRLAPDRLEQVRSALQTELAADARNPGKAVQEAFGREAFAGHPFARSESGEATDVAAVTVEELAAHHRRLIARDNLRIVLVGDLVVEEARALLDTVFARLPAKADLVPIPHITPQTFTKRLPGLPGQAFETAVFSLPAPALATPEFYPALALTHIIGSGNLDARLTVELRVKRGLTYAVGNTLVATPEASYLLGSLSTRPGKMDEALAVLKDTLAKIAREGVKETELANAKSGLIGSYLARHDTSAALASHLLALAVDGLPPDYGEKRRHALSRLDPATVSAQARSLFDPKGLSVLVLGTAPEGSAAK